MQALSLDLFLQAGQDFERSQYQILDGLQRVRRDFTHNIIYPHLSDLVNLLGTLKTLVQQLGDMRQARPGEITGIDPVARAVVFDRAALGWNQMDAVEELVQWALPQIQATIEEGRTIYEFVDEHLHLAEVGLVPSYLEEGYLFVPDLHAGMMHILQYQLSIITDAEERFRSLRTAHLRTVPYDRRLTTPQSLKLELVAERKSLPNPATYAFEAELDFPFEATMLPVAKRKLMQYLARETGQA